MAKTQRSFLIDFRNKAPHSFLDNGTISHNANIVFIWFENQFLDDGDALKDKKHFEQWF